MICLLTIFLLAGSIKWIALHHYSFSKTLIAKCVVLNDPSTGPRGIPNCVCWEKVPENPGTEYRFNRDGYRAGFDLGPKQPGTYRIVMTGSSFAMGHRVTREESFAALLPGKLSSRTGRSIELYNEAMAWGFAHPTALRFKDVLAAKPDLILWVIDPLDVQKSGFVSPLLENTNPHHTSSDADSTRSLPARFLTSFKSRLKGVNGGQDIVGMETAIMLRHWIYRSQSIYVKSWLMESDDAAGYLRDQPSPLWKSYLQQFDLDAADIEEQAKAAGIPFVAAYVPDRAQAAMISSGQWPEGYNPYKLGDELRAIVESHGGTYIDISSGFRTVPMAEQYFIPVDGHPNPRGQSIICDLLLRELTGGAVPSLNASGLPQTALANGK